MPNGNRAVSRRRVLGGLVAACLVVSMMGAPIVRAQDQEVVEPANAAELASLSGNILVDGDSVVLIKDLKVKGAGQTLKRGTVIRSIRLTDNPEEIDCRLDAIKGLVLRTEFVRKR